MWDKNIYQLPYINSAAVNTEVDKLAIILLWPTTWPADPTASDSLFTERGNVYVNRWKLHLI